MNKLNILFIPAGWMQATNQPDPETLMRLEYGLLEWWKGSYDVIVVTGGTFRPSHVQTISAGQILANWLVENGVPAYRIVIEGYALDTYQNIRFGMMALRKHVGNTPVRITVVSHWQHTLRIAVTFWRMLGMNVAMLPLWYIGSFTLLCKELAALFVHLADPDGSGSIVRENRHKRQLRTD